MVCAAHADRRAAAVRGAPLPAAVRMGRTLRGGLDAAQEPRLRQYLRAVQTLATVHRLLMPAIQVNVAEKQINVVS